MSGFLEALQAIGVRKYLVGAEDAHGNVEQTWTAPVEVMVYAVAPTSSTEPYEPGREAVVTGLTVLAPSNTDVERLDRVIVAGEEYTVEGDIDVWDFGPFAWSPGLSFNLKRVEG